MLNVKVRVFATFREILGMKEVDLQFPANTTIRTLIHDLSEKYSQGKLKGEILDKNANVRKYVKILVNGRDIDFLDGLSTQLNDGDVIAIFPPVGGGS